ncbi:MAG TPA: hypothetical protein VKP30_27110 [Polyangiaceae bacterium]|nr:hypothetical protein [Polyangiaceae bacterium]
MTELRRWVDELPVESPARELLLAGKEARVPEGSRNRGWQALALTLGAASTTAAVTAPAAGAVAGATQTAVAAKTTAALTFAEAAVGTAQTTVAAKGALGGASFLIGLKSIAVGFGVGLGVLGATEVVQRVVDRTPSNSVAVQTSSNASNRLQKRSPGAAARPSPTAVSSGAEAVEPQAVPRDHVLPESSLPPPLSTASIEVGKPQPINANTSPELVLSGSTAISNPRVATERQLMPLASRNGDTETNAVVAEAVAEQQSVPVAPRKDGEPGTATSKASSVAERATTPSLAKQARELAQIQRLIDAGDTTEAIRRLEASLDSHADSGLSEERDALHIRALIKAQRTTQAAILAKRFIQRYPNSPHAERMRHFLQPE